MTNDSKYAACTLVCDTCTAGSLIYVNIDNS